MPLSAAVVEAKLNAIEAEMKRIGMWQARPLTADQLDFHAAFGGDKMAFEQWLQFIFISNVRDLIAANGKFPNHSQVADQAFREWRMWGDREGVDQLLELLNDFDALFS